MQPEKIRVITICVFRHGNLILAAEGWDPVKGEQFYRPLGGGLEFGESSREAVAREIREEVGAEVEGLHYLGMLENIFTHHGRRGHEIVLVYDGTFVDRSLYERTIFTVEENGLQYTAFWKSLDEFQPGQPPLYPNGLLALLTNGG